MRPVVKILSVKQFLCVFLVLWFGVLSNWAQAHATQEAAHEIAHVMNDADVNATPDADHEEHCGLAHCCHSIAVPSTQTKQVHLTTRSDQPAPNAMRRPRFAPPEIERPKWALATHAVASF